ncbi:SigE family RNA polymerase sigma factor [Nonomuraea sp. 3-1Str]|uniref:SigE family RNA polymerase sigma factor n=1 Tax=unclassified Nonomuraea TaxID=2593643 RepID=UPI0028590CCD|nr:SigE family RNA polymerase sigma factor [Nonomuraea sp. 3-1Str]MDR8408292.1 SigE family RNA polymerase sigma factor [Nonomuraea sp. 3-1Str]
MDDPTFESFAAQRLPALYRYAMVLTQNRHDAEDLVQEALTRTGLRWHAIRRKDDPEGYVRTAMVRIMANRWRRPKREVSMAAPPEAMAEDLELQRLLDDDGLRSRVAALPPRMRAVLVLRYVEARGDEEIARLLGCSRGTVKSQASRGLARLREAVKTEEVEHG